ncbi:hypothetical protein CATMIT_01666, partial [Catenibacterium mitsuokai DSM 15897]
SEESERAGHFHQERWYALSLRHVVFVALVALNEARQSDHSAVPAQRRMIEKPATQL